MDHVKGSRQRRVKHRLAVGVSAAACSSLALSAVAVQSTTAGAAAKLKNPPYYIAAELSLSGAYSSFEIPMQQGLEVAVEDINKSGGVLGHKVALDVQSDASQTTKVTPALESIFSGTKAKRVVFMLPNVLPPVTDTVLEFTQQYGIASFDPGSGGDVFTVTKHPYNYSIYPSNTLQTPSDIAAFKELEGSFSAVKLGVMHDTETADITLTTEITKAAKAAGMTVVGTAAATPGATDVSVQMGQLKADGANVVVVESGGGVATAAATALLTLGWKTVKLVEDAANVNAKTQSSFPATVRSQIVTLAEQVYMSNSAGTGVLPRFAAFAKELKATTGGIDDLEISANIRDSAVLDAWAINKAKSTTIKKVAKILNNLGKYTLPSGLLIWMPDPKYTATNHTVSNSTFDHNYWALLSPGTEVTGTLKGQKLTVTATAVKAVKSALGG